jgi:hypothetical protein
MLRWLAAHRPWRASLVVVVLAGAPARSALAQRPRLGQIVDARIAAAEAKWRRAAGKDRKLMVEACTDLRGAWDQAQKGLDENDHSYVLLLEYKGKCAAMIDQSYMVAIPYYQQADKIRSISYEDQTRIDGEIADAKKRAVHVKVVPPSSYATFVKADRVKITGPGGGEYPQFEDEILIDPGDHEVQALTPKGGVFYRFSFHAESEDARRVDVRPMPEDEAVASLAKIVQDLRDEAVGQLVGHPADAQKLATTALAQHDTLPPAFQVPSFRAELESLAKQASGLADDAAWTSAKAVTADNQRAHVAGHAQIVCAQIAGVAAQKPTPSRWRDVAACFEAQGSMTGARNLLESALETAPAEARSGLTTQLAAVKAKICHMHFVVPTVLPGNDATVRVDGVVLPGGRGELDPGEHQIDMSADGESLSTVVRLGQGESGDREIEVPRSIRPRILLQGRGAADVVSDPELWAVSPEVGGFAYYDWGLDPWGPFFVSSGIGGTYAFRMRNRVTSDIPGQGVATEAVQENVLGASASLLVGRVFFAHRRVSWSVDLLDFGVQVIAGPDFGTSGSWRPSTWLSWHPPDSRFWVFLGVRAATHTPVTVQDYRFNLAGPKAVLSRDLSESVFAPFLGGELGL